MRTARLSILIRPRFFATRVRGHDRFGNFRGRSLSICQQGRTFADPVLDIFHRIGTPIRPVEHTSTSSSTDSSVAMVFERRSIELLRRSWSAATLRPFLRAIISASLNPADRAGVCRFPNSPQSLARTFCRALRAHFTGAAQT